MDTIEVSFNYPNRSLVYLLEVDDVGSILSISDPENGNGCIPFSLACVSASIDGVCFYHSWIASEIRRLISGDDASPSSWFTPDFKERITIKLANIDRQ